MSLKCGIVGLPEGHRELRPAGCAPRDPRGVVSTLDERGEQ